jgi:mannose-6-phosphate isomerase
MELQDAEFTAGEESFHSLLCLSGKASLLKQGGEELKLKKGSSVFLPAGCGPYRIRGNCTVLITTV